MNHLDNTQHRTVLTGICLVPSSGGVPKAVEDFKQALNAAVVSFTTESLYRREGGAFPGIEHVLTPNHWLGRSYQWAPGKRRKRAEAMASRAELISCDVMLRYHALWVRSMARRFDIPYWFVPHGQLDPYVYTYRTLVKKVWIAFFGKRLLREAAHVIFATEREKEKAEWVHRGDNRRVVHWPVDLMATTRRQEARQATRSRIGAKETDKVLVFLGRLHPMKRPLETIEAFCRLRARGTHLVMMGMENGIRLDQCRELADQHGMSDRVHVLGPVFGEEKNEILLGGDGYISLSIRENFGYTAAESLSAGLPVILSPGNDLGKDLQPRGCGWFLADDRMDTAVSAIAEWSESSTESLLAMGKRGRSFIAEECSFERFQKTLVSLRVEAIQTHRRKYRKKS